ncbi:MAG: hypothetical protein DRP37_06810 [Thermodesulfobacteriota bacterium]|nr:MAG: hypothetical protein DRP37_06810 [Thermodesulfobacteriota bacterium]
MISCNYKKSVPHMRGNEPKISPIVIGLTIVAFGTSAPEMGVALSAALSGRPETT